MAKKVVGVYDNQTELIESIEQYKNSGYSVQDFSIIGDTTELSTALESRTGVTTENLSTDGSVHNNDGGFWQNLMSAFEGDQNLGGNSPSLSERLVGLGLTEDSAREYEEDVRAGRIILLAETTGSGIAGTGYESGIAQTGYASGATVSGTDTYGTDEQTLRLREEQLNVSKETVQTGEVEVHKEVVEEQKTVNVPVSREEIYVERREVNETDASYDSSSIDDGETIRVPIMEEKVEVTKRPVVTEELVIGKREVTETEQVIENVKREEAHLETDGNNTVVDSDLDLNRDGFKGR